MLSLIFFTLLYLSSSLSPSCFSHPSSVFLILVFQSSSPSYPLILLFYLPHPPLPSSPLSCITPPLPSFSPYLPPPLLWFYTCFFLCTIFEYRLSFSSRLDAEQSLVYDLIHMGIIHKTMYGLSGHGFLFMHLCAYVHSCPWLEH